MSEIYGGLFNLRDIAHDVSATRYFAEEPLDGYVAPSALRVWSRRNLPTLIVLYDRLRWLIGMALCERFGHGEHWVDDGYGGPEGGCEAGHCLRCGATFHVTLY